MLEAIPRLGRRFGSVGNDKTRQVRKPKYGEALSRTVQTGFARAGISREYCNSIDRNTLSLV